LLKSKKHKSLQSSKKPYTKETLNEKIGSIIETRGELVNLQKQILDKDREFTEREQDLKLKLLELKIKNKN